VTEEVLSVLEGIMNAYMDCYIDRKFHSLEFLDLSSEIKIH